MRAVVLFAALAALSAAGLAQAQTETTQTGATQTCTANAPLPAELSPWATKANLTAAGKAGDVAKAALTPGKAVSAKLLPTKDVKFVMQPEKPGGSVASAGMFEIKVDKAGRYGIALSSAAWLDVVKGGKGLVSVAHGRGPTCSTIRKIVDFDLEPGRYTVQVSANPEPEIGVLLIQR